MSARVLDGGEIARQIRDELRPRIDVFRARSGRSPGLGIVLVGENAASEIYVRNKLKAASDVRIRADLERLPSNAALADVLRVVEHLNASGEHDAILVQSPLPAAMGTHASQAVFDAISPAKDVDGLHTVNVGRLVQNRPLLAPCTPSGVIELLDRSGVRLARATAVVVGRSEIVGKPMAMLLLHRDATVTLCHSKTPDLAAVAARADILVAAIGRPGLITREFVKPGAAVVDVGVNRVTDPAVAERLLGSTPGKLAEFARRGWAVVGDVHPGAAEVAGALTPVPGGVGPITIAMLLSNTLRAAEARLYG